MKRFRNPNVLLRHDTKGVRTSASIRKQRPESRSVEVGKESIHETLFRAIQSVVKGEFGMSRQDDNIVRLVLSPSREICATRNYQLPVKHSAAFHSIDELHECLRPILVGIALTIRTFINVIVFNSESYRESGGLQNDSVQVISPKPTSDERNVPFRYIADVKNNVFIFVIREGGKYRLINVGPKTWFEEQDLKRESHLLRVVLG